MNDLFPPGAVVIVSYPFSIGFYQGLCKDGERHRIKLRDGRRRYVRKERLRRPMVWKPAGGYLRIACFAETIEEATR